MKYAIIGSGAIGSAIASQFARQGIDVLVANSRGPASLNPLVEELGINIIPTALQDALQAEVVILAVPFKAIPEVVQSVSNWNNRIVVDASNAIDFPAFTPTDLDGHRSSEVVANAVPGARIVKAFNTLPAAVLAEVPSQGSGRRVVFLSGNDAAANTQIARLIEQLGFAPIELGKLTEGGQLQQFGEALMVHNLILQA